MLIDFAGRIAFGNGPPAAPVFGSAGVTGRILWWLLSGVIPDCGWPVDRIFTIPSREPSNAAGVLSRLERAGERPFATTRF